MQPFTERQAAPAAPTPTPTPPHTPPGGLCTIAAPVLPPQWTGVLLAAHLPAQAATVFAVAIDLNQSAKTNRVILPLPRALFS